MRDEINITVTWILVWIAAAIGAYRIFEFIITGAWIA